MDRFAETFNLSVAEARVLLSVVVVVGLVLLNWLVLRIVHRRIEEPDVWYRARKIGAYVTTILILFALFRIWVIPVGELATFLGLLSAGVAIALADVLKNMAGWAYILGRRPFRVGDRIQIGEVSGDVIDIRMFRFSLLEIGNWVDADQSTGRIIHVPNGLVFTEKVANYTEGFAYVWHEIPVLVTFESDWHRAEQILRQILIAAAPDLSAEVRNRIRKTAQEYRIRYEHLSPTVYVSAQDSGVLLTARLLVGARQRRSVDEKVWRHLLDAFAEEPNIDLAYPTVRTYFQGPIQVRDEP